jgi:hypothetical protein
MPAILMMLMLVCLVMYPPLGAILALVFWMIVCSKGAEA